MSALATLTTSDRLVTDTTDSICPDTASVARTTSITIITTKLQRNSREFTDEFLKGDCKVVRINTSSWIQSILQQVSTKSLNHHDILRFV